MLILISYCFFDFLFWRNELKSTQKSLRIFWIPEALSLMNPFRQERGQAVSRQGRGIKADSQYPIVMVTDR